MFSVTIARSRPHQYASLKLFVKTVRSRHFSCSCPRLRDEIHQVQVGGNGFIKLNIIKPTQEPVKHQCLIYLPPGPFPKQSSPSWPSVTASELASALPTITIIDIQYRLARRDISTEIDHRFPTPVHDVFAAFDYIKEALEEHASATQVETPKIAIYGSHIGGALGLSLALTNPNSVHAVVLENPLVDWPILEEIAGLSSSKRKKADASTKDIQVEATKALIALRNGLFRTPSGYFDAFASPVLFLRAPGRDTPLANSTAPASSDQAFFQGSPIRYGDEDDEVGLVEYEDQAYGPYDDEWHAAETRKERNQYYRLDDTEAQTQDVSQMAHAQEDGMPLERGSIDRKPATAHPRRRKVLQRWPPNAYSEDAILPLVHILTGSREAGADELTDGAIDISPVVKMQATELAELLRRACFWGREKSFAEERVTLELLDGSTDVGSRGAALIRHLDRLLR